MDSEEDDDDDILMKKPLPQPQPELKNSTDEQNMFSPTPVLTCTRSHSASSACNHTPAKVPYLFSLTYSGTDYTHDDHYIFLSNVKINCVQTE